MRDRRPRFPGYDVLAKRDSPSWNEQTRRVIDARLAAENEPRFCTPDEWQTLKALCDCIVPQEGSAQVAIAAMIDRKLERDQRDGYRPAALPPQRVAWRRGLRAVDDEARSRYGVSFHELPRGRQETLVQALREGDGRSAAWCGMPAAVFMKSRVIHDIATSYYAHPYAWNQIGFGGPASPRGYVRMDFNRRDPWEAVERDER